MKMTEVNASGVYDLLYPSPLPLKNTIAISIAVALWREEINKYRSKNALNKLYLGKELPLDNLITYLPSTILDLIKKYSKKFGSSIQHWLKCHYRHAFKFHHNDPNKVLEDFNDFVGDFDGNIDFCKTAKRVMLCDRFSDLEKFIIACEYCLEHDAAKYWPSVQSRINLSEFEDETLGTLKWCLCYWLYHFSSKSSDLDNFGKLVMMHININTATTVEYFWNKIDSTTRIEAAIQLFYNFHADKSCRFVLPKLTENELDQFILSTGDDLIPYCLDFMWIPLVIPLWRLMKSRLTESNFLCIIRKMLEKQFNNQRYMYYPDTTSCHEIWVTAPDNWKQLAIHSIFSDSSVFSRKSEYYSTCRQNDLLFLLLSDVTIEERKAFWNKNWSNLIVGTNAKDLDYLLKLCIADPDEIDQFKEIELSNYENITPSCIEYINRRDFQKLDEFLIFCIHDEELRKNIKSRLLYEHFEFQEIECNMNGKLFDEFIKSAFDDEDQVIEFKNYLSETLVGNQKFLRNVSHRYYQVMEIVDTVVLSEEVAVNLKKFVFPVIIRYDLAFGTPYVGLFEAEKMSNFLRWCFAGDEEKITEFKQSLPIEKIVRAIKEKAISENKPDERKNRNFEKNSKLDEFLLWYFNTTAAVTEFKSSLPDVFEDIDLLNHYYL